MVGPAAERERYLILDVLRELALMGIGFGKLPGVCIVDVCWS